MQQSYQITGMTCEGCRHTVTEALNKADGVLSVQVDLENQEATIQTEGPVPVTVLGDYLPEKYAITRRNVMSQAGEAESPSKWRQLRPLLLIFAYLIAAAVLLNFRQGTWQQAMLDFMGLFFVVFSFFKFLDYKGFPASFSMYDPLARTVPAYGWVYPFLELGLGLLYLMRLYLVPALLVTLVVLGVTTIGVTRNLLGDKKIRCACLGTALDLPMTEATLIENALMILMAIVMLLQTGLL